MITNGDLKGIIEYETLFYAVSGMLPLRTLSYPKILSYLKKLAAQYPFRLKQIYATFIYNEIESAYSRKDIFALLWLAYMVVDSDDELIRRHAAAKLRLMRRRNKIINDMIVFLEEPESEINLWGSNGSQLVFSRNEYLDANALFDYLGISFAES